MCVHHNIFCKKKKDLGEGDTKRKDMLLILMRCVYQGSKVQKIVLLVV